MRLITTIIVASFIAFNSYGQTNRVEKNAKIKDSLSSPSYLIKADQIRLQTALQLTALARKKAHSLGKDVSVAILDANGQTIVISRGDGVGIHNTEAARRKAFTAASTKTATLLLARNAKTNPDTENLNSLPELLLMGGGIPLYHHGKVIGAIGIAGGGSPENDDLIARSASIREADIIAR